MEKNKRKRRECQEPRVEILNNLGVKLERDEEINQAKK